MLPDFRFVIGAILAITVLGIAAFGLATAVRMSHDAKVGPLEAMRSLAFDERADWNQFSDPELARRFDVLARQPEAAPAMPVPDPVAPAEVPQAALAVPAVEAPARGEPATTIASTPAPAEPAVTGAIATKPVEPRAIIAEIVVPANVADPITEAAHETGATAERKISIAAVAPNEVAPAVVESSAALPVAQLRTPTPKPRPKQALAKRPKAKVAKAKPHPRTAAQQPAAPTAPAPQPVNDVFDAVLFRN
jgi:hypothetical protein